MMIDLSEMAEEHQQEAEWHAADNPWIDELFASEVERLNLYQRMYNGED